MQARDRDTEGRGLDAQGCSLGTWGRSCVGFRGGGALVRVSAVAGDVEEVERLLQPVRVAVGVRLGVSIRVRVKLGLGLGLGLWLGWGGVGVGIR